MKEKIFGSILIFAMVAGIGACTGVEKSYDSVSAQMEGDQFYNDGKYEQAVESYKKAIYIDADGILHYKLARAYEKTGDKELAIENLKIAEEMARFLHQKVTKKLKALDKSSDEAEKLIDDKTENTKELEESEHE